MKSMLQEPKRRLGTGRGANNPGERWVEVLVVWQTGQPETKVDTDYCIRGHHIRYNKSAINFLDPKCAPVGVQCNSCMRVRLKPCGAGSTSCNGSPPSEQWYSSSTPKQDTIQKRVSWDLAKATKRAISESEGSN